jgi:hypothetical protein
MKIAVLVTSLTLVAGTATTAAKGFEYNVAEKLASGRRLVVWPAHGTGSQPHGRRQRAVKPIRSGLRVRATGGLMLVAERSAG